MDQRPDEWLISWMFGLLGGTVNNIIVPARRGILGFAAAAVVGGFCGGLAGTIAWSSGFAVGVQWAAAGLCGVCGDRILTWVLTGHDGITNVNGGRVTIHQGDRYNQNIHDQAQGNQGDNNENDNK